MVSRELFARLIEGTDYQVTNENSGSSASAFRRGVRRQIIENRCFVCWSVKPVAAAMRVA
jgi:uncharacterized membrane protein